MTRAFVRAAGGVVWRRNDGIEIAVVHRPRYDDWSLPKGKLRAGESELAAAVREVGEELGARVAVRDRLGTVEYAVPAGSKAVTYWAMQHLDGSFAAGSEVAEIAWVAPKPARKRLSYAADSEVVAEFAARPPTDSMILLVRHAKAGKRQSWQGEDAARPLEPVGQAQAHRLAALLSYFAPDRIVSAEPLRCVQTVQPLADRLGLPVQVDPVLGDASYSHAPRAAEAALLALAKPGRVSVVCSQGTTIPGLIERFGRLPSVDTRKAAFWALSAVDGAIVSADYYPDAS